MANKASEYRPSEIKFQPLKNKIYHLSWKQFGTERGKLLTKATCLKMANDPNVAKELRDKLVEAFKEGIVE